ncbi:unnamed protein product [Ceratitis capitata]|uniref:(Mediterranean fruit fly) hypothetical protein n=1 Tax=Ceratitis capitata TaxID=7213 RepID=A0A811VD02_CERCA|nr:unnamed protein product [Ceratitis capitata]
MKIKPVGGKAPTLLSHDMRRSWNERQQGRNLAMFCPAQAYPVPTFRFLFIEPVSAKAPTLSVDTKWSGIERRQKASFAILCPAQAYPVPAYRYTTTFMCTCVSDARADGFMTTAFCCSEADSCRDKNKQKQK